MDIPFVLTRRAFRSATAADVIVPTVCSMSLAAFVAFGSPLRLPTYLSLRGLFVLLVSVVFSAALCIPLFLNQQGVGADNTGLYEQSNDFLAQQILVVLCALTAAVPFANLEVT